jgi:hypothetical protein
MKKGDTMIRNLFRIGLTLVLLLVGSTMTLASPAVAGTAVIAADSGAARGNVPAQPKAPPFAASSSPTTSPSNPVDPGTGETGEAKQSRVEYAPYVIGGIIALALIAAVLFWRKRRVSRPKKPA